MNTLLPALSLGLKALRAPEGERCVDRQGETSMNFLVVSGGTKVRRRGGRVGRSRRDRVGFGGRRGSFPSRLVVRTLHVEGAA